MRRGRRPGISFALGVAVLCVAVAGLDLYGAITQNRPSLLVIVAILLAFAAANLLVDRHERRHQ